MSIVNPASQFEARQAHPIDPHEVQSMMVLGADDCARIISERQEWGADRFDEVWEGQYMMAPNASWDHQDLVAEIGYILHQVAKELGGYAHQGDNVTDREKNWTKNFRVPDVLVVLPGSKAKKFSAGLIGGPDFVVEVLSPGDRSLDKLPFYAKLGSREVLHLDQKSKDLALYRLIDNQMQSIGNSSTTQSASLTSAVLPLSFQVIRGKANDSSILEIRHADGSRVWQIGG